ncbi:hypothetical protein E2C01_069190 [Portunus trituberculatus]|uniref:Uncharacterized protein n=1 Tax=Portunus trituberculatus TaxID=210409 RepID=A0A5B7HXX0_PORTR|nr:hypothetical protein [Portunus trituberculatus]
MCLPQQSVPRRRSHSSGGSSSGSSSGAIVGSPSLAPYQMISGLPNPAPAQMPPSTLPHIAPAPAPPPAVAQVPASLMVQAPVLASVQANGSSSTPALLAHLLTSVTSVAQPMVSTSRHKTEGDGIKTTSLVIPGLITGCGSPTTSCITSNNTVYTLSSDMCSVKPVATASLIMPPITLSAVTPSNLKTQTYSQVCVLSAYCKLTCGTAKHVTLSGTGKLR